MNKRSKLAVLLAAILVCAMVFTGMALATAIELNADIADVEAALSADQVQAQLVYNQLMECTTLAEFRAVMLKEENKVGLQAMNFEQMDALYQHVDALYAAIANPTEEDTALYNEIINALDAIAGIFTEVITFAKDIVLDLSKGNITITPSGFTAFDENGEAISGTDTNVTVTTSSATSNNITLSGSNMMCNLTLKDVQRTGGIGIEYKGEKNNNCDVTILLAGDNNIGQLYYTGNSKLKITSASGDGSTEGKLTVAAAERWNAAIGGEDSDDSFGDLTIAGGTIVATATDGSAIGGGGNGTAKITIAGGNVTATNSGTSAAIGGGGGQGSYGGKGTVIITGGTVIANNTGTTGVAIGGGGSERSYTVGDAEIQLLGGNVTAIGGRYGFSGGYSQIGDAYNVGDAYAATNITIGADVIYSGTINPNATITRLGVIFDLSKARVVFDGNTYSGMDMAGNAITGTHAEGNKYIVRQSNAAATQNTINLNNKITGTVHLEIDGINSSAVNSINIPAGSGEEKDVVLYLSGTNRINNLLYYTGAQETSTKSMQSSSTLKITSAAGDGSTSGSLTIEPPSITPYSENPIYYNAGIGGTDGRSGVAGLTISGGTIKVTVDATHDCSAIGGGGNGYAQITITGGYIEAENASTGATIGGGVGYTAPGSGCDILITGGTVIAKNNGKLKQDHGIDAQCYGVAIGGGSSYRQSALGDEASVTINGGNVTAIVPAGQTAIGAGNSYDSNAGNATVKVNGGTVDCEGGIGGGTSTKENGGNAKLIVTDGHLTVKGFIGGGASKEGDLGGTATVNIGGSNTVVKAASIGGGVAEAKNIVSKANVTITNGQVQAQILMEGAGSTFDMSGGTVDNSNAKAQGFTFKKDDGGAVYCANGVATMTGGVIQNCSTEGYGGAIYITGGNFTLKGTGKIDHCSAKEGGAAYVGVGNIAGNFIMEGGEITYCEAETGGAVRVSGGNANISGGSINNNTADANGGGVYVTNGNLTMSGGAMSENTAVNGGAAYVAGGNFTMSDGTIGGEGTGNTATADGGAVYVTGGAFTMSNGSITHNTATGNGGAVYIVGGNYTMEHGFVNNNSAVQGGAVYLAGDSDTIFKMESGQMNSNTASDDGGAIYATSGTMYIGLQGCSGSTADADGNVTDENEAKHQTEHGCGITDADKCTHPKIQNNTAADCGGGIAIANSGAVHFYCGNATGNEALYKGVGMNVFMNGGDFYLYDGANVGKPRDPDLVIVGGELHNECVVKDYVYLYYYQKNTDTDTEMQGMAAYGEVINLTDGEYFWPAEEGKIFIGWTAQGAVSGDVSNEYVRNKDQYVASGQPVEVLDHKTEGKDQTAINTNRLFDGTTDKIMHLYALWAPIQNNITYVDGLTYAVIENTDATYKNVKSTAGYDATVRKIEKPGYELTGWYIYQNENQNANWGADYEPKWKDATKQDKGYADLDLENMKFLPVNNADYTLHVDPLTFGAITMIAKFDYDVADLIITKTGLADGDSAIFIVEGVDANNQPKTWTIALQNGGSATIADLQIESDYTITEITGWSVYYNPIEKITGKIQPLDEQGENPNVVKIANREVQDKWLHDEDYKLNVFGANAAANS